MVVSHEGYEVLTSKRRARERKYNDCLHFVDWGLLRASVYSGLVNVREDDERKKDNLSHQILSILCITPNSSTPIARISLTSIDTLRLHVLMAAQCVLFGLRPHPRLNRFKMSVPRGEDSDK